MLLYILFEFYAYYIFIELKYQKIQSVSAGCIFCMIDLNDNNIRLWQEYSLTGS